MFRALQPANTSPDSKLPTMSETEHLQRERVVSTPVLKTREMAQPVLSFVACPCVPPGEKRSGE